MVGSKLGRLCCIEKATVTDQIGLVVIDPKACIRELASTCIHMTGYMGQYNKDLQVLTRPQHFVRLLSPADVLWLRYV